MEPKRIEIVNVSDPYDLAEKGRKYDALKKRNDELVKVLKKITNHSNEPYQHYWATCANSELYKINKLSNQALKNNEND